MSCVCSQVLPGSHCCTLSAMRAVVSHRGMYQKGDLEEYGPLLAPEDYISGIPAPGEVRSGPSSKGQGDPLYRSASSFQEELSCLPGVEGGYMVQAHLLHASLP